MFNINEALSKLCKAYGMSGYEDDAAKLACEYLKEYADNAYVDHFGNVIATIGDDLLKPHLLLDAHIDEVSYIVTYITDEGFLVIDGVGGCDCRLLLAQEVTILGKEKIKGIITSIPPHLSDGEDKAPKFSDIYVDIGMTKENAEKIISLGDRVIIDNDAAMLLNNRITTKALDDRAGVVAILAALDKLKGKELPYRLSVLFSAGEETSMRGAPTATYKISPDLAIIVDVSFALTVDDSEQKCGKMSKGVMIGVSPTLNRAMSNRMIELAKEEKIAYQVEVMPGKTGTNADVIGISKSGVKTVTLSIPIRYMHTPVETCDIDDIQKVSQLIASFVLNGGVK